MYGAPNSIGAPGDGDFEVRVVVSTPANRGDNFSVGYVPHGGTALVVASIGQALLLARQAESRIRPLPLPATRYPLPVAP